MPDRLAAFVSGRRTKWLVPLLWIGLLAVFAPLGAKLTGETTDDTESFLPAGAESTRVSDLLNSRFESGQALTGVVVYRREGGLTARDRGTIAADARRAAAGLPLVAPPAVPFRPGSDAALVSPDGTVAYTVVQFPDDAAKLGDWGKELRGIVGTERGGPEAFVTGDAGYTTDFDEVFSSTDVILLAATMLLVLVLLGAIYRSVMIALTPLVVVFAAYMLAQGLIYLYATSGAPVSSDATGILIVLMFGVGTDYCLLLLSRYREELRRHEDKHDAMRRAVRRAGPSILASGSTVAVAMLVLLVADTRSISSLGPVMAIGVACAVLAGLTLLPALLTIGGRRAFWPRRATVAYDPDHAGGEARGPWRRLGDRVLRRPAAAFAVTAGFFAVASLGVLGYTEDYSPTNYFKKPTESVDGFRVMERAFPAGASNPMTVLVERSDGPVGAAAVADVRRRMEGVDGVARVERLAERSEDGRIARLGVVLDDDPFSGEALALVPVLRERLAGLEPGTRALVGGGSAVQYDYDSGVDGDIKVIVPLALLVITLILIVLLRALVAPLVLIGTVLLSFFGTLGLSIVFFRTVVGEAGFDSELPVFAFIFLVALGIDYTIFLMGRVREEARRHGTREGMLRALTATGPVITSAGLILAGTFSVLMTFPVTFAFYFGFMVAVGILLDTFVVRTIMLPAAVELIGDRIWWPSTAQGGRAALHEEAAAPGPVRSRTVGRTESAR
jgi:putative drug exporter of the RND superfamily